MKVRFKQQYAAVDGYRISYELASETPITICGEDYYDIKPLGYIPVDLMEITTAKDDVPAIDVVIELWKKGQLILKKNKTKKMTEQQPTETEVQKNKRVISVKVTEDGFSFQSKKLDPVSIIGLLEQALEETKANNHNNDMPEEFTEGGFEIRIVDNKFQMTNTLNRVTTLGVLNIYLHDFITDAVNDKRKQKRTWSDNKHGADGFMEYLSDMIKDMEDKKQKR